MYLVCYNRILRSVDTGKFAALTHFYISFMLLCARRIPYGPLPVYLSSQCKWKQVTSNLKFFK
jgi:hypothetical protein